MSHESTILVNVDGVNVNASHFAKMDKETAIQNMIADGFTNNEEWAAKAWEASVQKVEEAKQQH